ncbi:MULTISPECIES: hypothetical protein [unclassified Clostridium]|uniref:hypothetical protein n=1 Tax=unclassified Clostridium TaxID=2614128 RepID=UPI000297253B|nr:MULTISPECIES: hypothetical protein [unclassified Clostridium]EKQ50553.1 MAG: hypothetical protein A370_05557 [Clostridium sp. Maddingley MBC34-26]
MNEEKKTYIPTPTDVSAEKLSEEISNNENIGKTTDSGERNARSKNNANISRTNLDTELIDVNADGDDDESKYSDLM